MLRSHSVWLIAVGILVFLVLVYVSAVILRMRALIAVSATLVAESKAYQQTISGGHPRILVLGDSTGVGTGTRDNKGSIAGRFGQDFPHAEIINLSINGLKTGQLDAHFPSYPPGAFDLVVLQIGANDVIRSTPLPAVSASLNSVFQKAKAIGSNVVALHGGNIGLAPLFSAWPIRTYFRSKTRALRTRYQQLATDNGVVYVDLFHERQDDPFREHPDNFYAGDGLHLTEAGYGNWYEEVRKSMTKAGITLPE